MLPANSKKRRHLVSESLRRRVADPAAVRNTYEFRAELQDVGQRQVADVGVLLTATNITVKKINKCTYMRIVLTTVKQPLLLHSEIAEKSRPFNPLLVN